MLRCGYNVVLCYRFSIKFVPHNFEIVILQDAKQKIHTNIINSTINAKKKQWTFNLSAHWLVPCCT